MLPSLIQHYLSLSFLQVKKKLSSKALIRRVKVTKTSSYSPLLLSNMMLLTCWPASPSNHSSTKWSWNSIRRCLEFDNSFETKSSWRDSTRWSVNFNCKNRWLKLRKPISNGSITIENKCSTKEWISSINSKKTDLKISLLKVQGISIASLLKIHPINSSILVIVTTIILWILSITFLLLGSDCNQPSQG